MNSNKKSMKEINKWLDNNSIVYPTYPYEISESNYEKYYTPYEIKKYSNNGKININPSTKRCDSNNIFCELINYCTYKKLYNDDDTLLINVKNKNSFYNFIFENSINTIEI